MTIGEKIKTLRINKGFTQKSLSEASGIHEVQIRKYELGKATPQWKSLEKIAGALGVSAIDLLHDENISTISDSFAASVMPSYEGLIKKIWLVNEIQHELQEKFPEATSTDFIYKVIERLEEKMDLSFKPNEELKSLLNLYSQLNPQGKQKVLEYAKDISEIENYKK